MSDNTPPPGCIGIDGQWVPVDAYGSPVMSAEQSEQARLLQETTAREKASLEGGKSRPKRDDDLEPHERKRGRSR